ncbi:hypothetical protein OV207_01495 [Corallococcus sp. BB11-1]|uniref:hypothetical protein n=1 Tax=Corallococcus sp. BB11-1 TaxID=2996783 RepID=UPI002270208A|nr:hypothetical protein [Corallococcus sp. BB11-1]MCY1030115.1 hypothetical protein [Corallococcus sp. BB11-1]
MALSTSAVFKAALDANVPGMTVVRAHGGDFVRPFCTALDAYHGDWSGLFAKATYYFRSAQPWAHAKLKALDDAEHLLYALFDQERARLVAAQAARMLLMRMLVEIQQAHIDLVDYLHTNNLKLYTPDRGLLGDAALRQLDADWDALRNGTGAVKLPSGAPYERGNREVRAIHARLLSRAHGRSLMRWILDVTEASPEWPVTLALTPAFTPSATFRQKVVLNKARLDTMSGQIEPLTRQFDELSGIVSKMETDARRGTEPWAVLRERLRAESREYVEAYEACEEVGSRLDFIKSELPRYEEDGHGEDYMLSEPAPGLAGKGTGRSSVLRLRTGLRDSTQRNFSSDGHTIPAPAFIVYGHELIHVLQNRYPQMMVLHIQPYAHGHGKHGYSNTTEHETIRSLRKLRTDAHLPFYENQLRAEHRLTARKHHTGTSAFDLHETD